MRCGLCLELLLLDGNSHYHKEAIHCRESLSYFDRNKVYIDNFVFRKLYQKTSLTRSFPDTVLGLHHLYTQTNKLYTYKGNK
jgi:hypothetical protein